MQLKDHAMSLEEMLTQAVREEGLPDGIVTSWVCVVEVLEGGSGGLQLVTLTDLVSPYWRHRGMLAEAAIEDDHDDDDD